MPKAFSKRKRSQIKRFFSSPRKSHRLWARAIKRGTYRHESSRGVVFDTKIGGKSRTVKIAEGETLSRLNCVLLERAHAAAVKNGTISPRNYSLKVVPYLYADKRVGIMETVPGVGFETLRDIASGKYDRLDQNLPWLKLGRGILEKNPGITPGKMLTAQYELTQTLFDLQKAGKIFSYDAHINNFMVTGQGKDGKLSIVLVDQLSPLDKAFYSKDLLEMGRSKRKRKI